ncbi:MAG: Flp pilus assembly protein CpaB [Phycisphaerales bacterium]|nr:Flp pilus assembly protein CpaB [Phycisphaerales bacterium]
MNVKAVVPLVAGLCIGGIALKMGLSSLQQAKGAQPNTVTLWALRADVPRGNAIDDSQLEARKFPANLVPAGAVTDKSQLTGRVLRTLAPAGVPVVESMLLPKDAKPGIWVKPGFRAVAVRIDESSGVDNHLEPGCRVDVVGYFSTRRSGKSEIIARTLIENVEVAAVGQRLTAAGEVAEKGEAGKKTSSTSAEKKVRAVTLLVKPEDVPSLHLAEQRGKIKLSMRGEGEAIGSAKPRSVAEDEVLGLSSGDGKSGLGGLLGKFGSLFGGSAEKTDAKALATRQAPKPEAKAEPAPPPPPQHAWIMTISNGSDQVKLGWPSLTSIDPQQIAAERNKRGGRSHATVIPNSPAGDPSQPNSFARDPSLAIHPDDAADTDSSDDNQEPEERFE